MSAGWRRPQRQGGLGLMVMLGMVGRVVRRMVRVVRMMRMVRLLGDSGFGGADESHTNGHRHREGGEQLSA